MLNTTENSKTSITKISRRKHSRFPRICTQKTETCGGQTRSITPPLTKNKTKAQNKQTEANETKAHYEKQKLTKLKHTEK